METVFEYKDVTQDKLEVDVLLKENHGKDAFMFTCSSHEDGRSISVIMSLPAANRLITILLREVEIIERLPGT